MPSFDRVFDGPKDPPLPAATICEQHQCLRSFGGQCLPCVLIEERDRALSEVKKLRVLLSRACALAEAANLVSGGMEEVAKLFRDAREALGMENR